MKLFSVIPDSWRRNIVNALGGSFDSATASPQRSSTVLFPLDSTREINPRERRELVKKHRSLRNNLGFVRGIINTTVELSIGWGLQPIPKSGNKDFDRRALAYWKRQTRRRNWDVGGRNHHAAMQRLTLREVITDGELFQIKVVDQFGRPQRQMIKTEQIGDTMTGTPDQNWQDGIWLNSLRRPLAYRVLQNPLPGVADPNPRGRIVEARNMLHVFEQERSMQCRGLPWGYTGLNHGVDMLDTVAFEKIAHKLNAAIIASMTTQSGDAPQGMQALMAAARQAKDAGTAAATPATRKDTAQGTRFLDLHGSMIPLFKVGEGMNFFNGRNSVNTVQFTGALAAWYSQGFGLPVEFVVGMAQGSAAVRGNTDLAGRFFERVQMCMIDGLCQPDWENVVGTGILAAAYPLDFPGVEPLDPPPGWTGWDVVEWRGPRNVQIDKMKDGKLAIELMRAGKMTDEEWWTLNGEDPSEMAEAIDDEIVAARDRWLQRGLPEDMFWRRMFGNNLPAQPAVEPPAVEGE